MTPRRHRADWSAGAHGSLRLHAMPDRRRVSRLDRLRQKLWAFRARLGMRLRRNR